MSSSLAIVPALLLGLATAAAAHGGPPLRLGVTAEDTALARLLLSHLRDGVGFAVEWKPYPDRAALRRALAERRIDVLVGLGAEEREADLPPEARGFFAAFSARGVAVARPVLADLRFTILGREVERLLAVLTAADLEAVREAERRGGERAGAAAARAALVSKGLR